jgi:hypothetical protein
VIVTDALDTWPARSKWTLDFFATRYADDVVTANSPMFLESDLGLERVQVEMRLADYVRYIQDPAQEPRGTFRLGNWESLKRNRLPLYDPAYRVLARHPELAEDVVSSPYFVEDLFARLPFAARRFLDTYGSPVHYLFLAPRGSVSFLHADYWGTHAYLAQLAGRKLCVLFSPTDGPNVYGGAIRNPLQVDAARFPLYAQATPHVGVLEAGEMVFIPSGWWHFVLGLEPSITYSYDFFTKHNMDTYFTFFFEAFTRLATTDAQALPPHVRRAVLDLHEAVRHELAERDATIGMGRPSL